MTNDAQALTKVDLCLSLQQLRDSLLTLDQALSSQPHKSNARLGTRSKTTKMACGVEGHQLHYVDVGQSVWDLFIVALK